MRIALAGNPNSGKTSVYNVITGSNEKVGNWAGVTVSSKQAKLKKEYGDYSDLTIVDLPGAYSMNAYTSEENITSDFVKNENVNVIINIVDAISLSRSLFFTTQLLEIGIPVIVALNKDDMLSKKEIDVDVDKLSELLNCPVVRTVSTDNKHDGLKQAIAKAVEANGNTQVKPYDAGNVDLTNKKNVQVADKARFNFVNSIVSQVEKRKVSSNKQNIQDKADRIIANKFLGIPIFIAVMWAVFSISQTYIGPPIADFLVGLIETFQGFVGDSLANASPVISAILVDGIIGGVGAVVGFLPLIMVMFFLLALLEDSGYMARVAVVMDRFLKVVGLSGKSIIPMVIGTACAIPGVMATRTIKNERQRRTTAMLTPFIPCGAKIPVIALFAGAFFNGAGWVSTLMYFSGIVLIIIGALLIVRITGEKNAKSFFIMEMPEYKMPSLKRATISMLLRAKAFIVKAATIILLCNMAVQIMQTFNWSFEVVAEGAEGTSILASIASPFALLLLPLGFGVWQLAAAAITGFIAKENVVGTLAVVYGITNFIDTDALELVGGASDVALTMGLTSVAALSYLMFNLFTPPCFAAIGAMNAEMESPKWLWAGIALQFSTGYVVSFFVYQIGTFITTGMLGTAFIPGLIAVIALIAILVYKVMQGNKIAAAKVSSAKKATVKA